MCQRVSDIHLLARPLVLELPFTREQVNELGFPVEGGYALGKRGDVASVGEVIYEDADGASEEGFGA